MYSIKEEKIFLNVLLVWFNIFWYVPNGYIPPDITYTGLKQPGEVYKNFALILSILYNQQSAHILHFDFNKFAQSSSPRQSLCHLVKRKTYTQNNTS